MNYENRVQPSLTPGCKYRLFFHPDLGGCSSQDLIFDFNSNGKLSKSSPCDINDLLNVVLNFATKDYELLGCGNIQYLTCSFHGSYSPLDIPDDVDYVISNQISIPGLGV